MGLNLFFIILHLYLKIIIGFALPTKIFSICPCSPSSQLPNPFKNLTQETLPSYVLILSFILQPNQTIHFSPKPLTTFVHLVLTARNAVHLYIQQILIYHLLYMSGTGLWSGGMEISKTVPVLRILLSSE